MYKLNKFITVLLILFTFILSSCSGKIQNNYTAREIAEAVLENAEFPKMTELSDKEDLIKYIDFNFNYAEDMCFFWQTISVELAEVLIIIPKKGMEQEALDFANSRRDKIMNDTAFYPSQEKAADASVSGVIGNVVYFICGNEAKLAEDFLINYLK